MALLVGVGDYLDAQLDIPGVEQDLAKAEQMVQSLGVPASATVTLYNGQATVAAVEAQLAVWADQLNPGDQAYIYFSTHGLQLADQNGDEPDGRDEALALADFRVFGTGKQSEVTGVLRDDRLGELLAALPNDRTLIIADTCHSGSIGKSLDDVLSRVGKFIQMPSWLLGQGRASTSVPLAELQLPGVVLLSAAADGELADIDESGSVFTRALQESQLNPEQDNAWCWFQRARSRVRRQTAGVQWPQFSGDFIQSISPLQGEDTGMFGVALTQACSSSAGFSVSVQTTRSGASLLAQSEQPGWVTAVSVRQHRDGLRFKSSGSRWHHGRGGETRLARLSSSTSKHSGAWVFWTADGVELPRHRGDFSLMWQALQTLSVDQWASAFVREVDLHGR
ncbi:MAG: caspase family protein [Granulosicoccaceae bacterium]